MRKTAGFLVILGLIVLGLAWTKDHWLPDGLQERWHEAWLSSENREVSPRDRLLAEHERLSSEIEKEYGEKIGREKQAYATLTAEYAKLTGKESSP
jgi:hypothetical protein